MDEVISSGQKTCTSPPMPDQSTRTTIQNGGEPKLPRSQSETPKPIAVVSPFKDETERAPTVESNMAYEVSVPRSRSRSCSLGQKFRTNLTSSGTANSLYTTNTHSSSVENPTHPNDSISSTRDDFPSKSWSKPVCVSASIGLFHQNTGGPQYVRLSIDQEQHPGTPNGHPHHSSSVEMLGSAPRMSNGNNPNSTVIRIINMTPGEPVLSQGNTASLHQLGHALSCQDSVGSPIQSMADRHVTICNFYYGSLSNFEAKEILKNSLPGTFLLRDSSNENFWYSLTVKTNNGTTSVRIVKNTKGNFRLDCEHRQETKMAVFSSVIELIDYYFRRRKSRHDDGSIQLEMVSKRADETYLTLRKPLEVSPSPLQHLCRKKLNSIGAAHLSCWMKRVKQLDRIWLAEYMAEYSFVVWSNIWPNIRSYFDEII